MKNNKNFDLIGLMFLGNISIIISAILAATDFLDKSELRIIAAIGIILFALSYYILLLIMVSHYIQKIGNFFRKEYRVKKKRFLINLTIIFFILIFPLLSKLLGLNKVIEIYAYVILTGILSGLILFLFTKDKPK